MVFEETASLGRKLAEEACGEHFAEKIAAVALGGKTVITVAEADADGKAKAVGVAKVG